MVKLDNELLETQEKLEKYFSKFESKWAEIIGNRIKTKIAGSEPSMTTSKNKYETFNNPSSKSQGI
jgi:hypothetical protein